MLFPFSPFFKQIFNSKLVLASPETATDADYAAILGVIGHEVCHKKICHLRAGNLSFIQEPSFNDLIIFLYCLAVFPQLDWQQVVS